MSDSSPDTDMSPNKEFATILCDLLEVEAWRQEQKEKAEAWRQEQREKEPVEVYLSAVKVYLSAVEIYLSTSSKDINFRSVRANNVTIGILLDLFYLSASSKTSTFDSSTPIMSSLIVDIQLDQRYFVA
ncbi:hypothetical protein MMC31_001029 [Peltigera leucophlebia]|nr:hypothetical protein [Peltigera leucophlebia]